MNITRNILWLSLLLLMAGIAGATDYYISPTGNDSTGDGSIGSPWKSLGKADSYLTTPGDTLYCRGGTYTDLSDTATLGINNDGNEENPITIRNYSGETPVFRSTAGSTGTSPVLRIYADWIVVDGLEFKPGHPNRSNMHAIVMPQGDNVVIRNCWFESVLANDGRFTSNKAIQITGDDCEVDSCTFKKFGYPDGTRGDNGETVHVTGSNTYIHDNHFEEGIHENIGLWGSATNCVIRDNDFRNAVGYGVVNYQTANGNLIEFNSFQGHGYSLDSSVNKNAWNNQTDENIFRYNVVYDCNSYGAGASQTTGDNTRNYNNAFWGGYHTGLKLGAAGSPQDNIWINNIIAKYMQDDDWDYYFCQIADLTSDGNDSYYASTFGNEFTYNWIQAYVDANWEDDWSSMVMEHHPSWTKRAVSTMEADPNFSDCWSNNLYDYSNPYLNDPDNGDFTITNASSSLINAGCYLTLTDGSGSGTSMTLDAGGGWFFWPGDKIAIGSTSNIATISTSWTRDANTLTLSASATWSDNDNIYLYSSAYDANTILLDGNSVDIGPYEYISTTTYDLTVVSGTGSDTGLTEGQEKTITASSHPDANYSFSAWTGQTAGCADVNASPTTYTMPASDASVTATYVSSEATTVDVNATKDTQIVYAWGASDDYNWGSSTSGLSCRGGNYDNRILLGGFDISGVGSSITSADLWMYNRWTEATSADVTAARLTRSWTEGTGTGGTAGAGVTYNKYDGTNDWTSAGGDWADDSTKTTDTIATTRDQWFSVDVTDIVQHWKDNAGSNYGIIIISDEAGDSDYFDIRTKEQSVSSVAYLRIVYGGGGSPTYTLTVNTGTGGDSGLTEGQDVTITASSVTGKTFQDWEGDTTGCADVNSSSTTYTMPAADAEVTATYTWNNYTLTVNTGSGGGSTYTYQQVVAIAADPVTGKTFQDWEGDTTGCADVNSSSTNYTMPASNAEVTATYTWNNYTLTVTSGSGDGSTYTYQQVIAIAAETHSDANYSFDKWTGDTSGCADANASSTNYTMAASDATIVATYVSSEATTVDVNATKDTQIVYSWGNADDYNYGSYTSGLSCRSGNYDNRILLGGFDISGVGSSITDAKLWMRNRWNQATSVDVTIARLTRSWTEGTGTGGTAGAGVTFNKYDGTNDWTSAGGDWADDSTKTTDTLTTSRDWFSVDVTDIVQHWKDNAGSNYGIIIVCDESTDSDFFDINAKEESSGQYTAYLQIIYGGGGSPTYTLTVNTGTGGDSGLTEGQDVTITASSVTGKTFQDWEGDTTGCADVNSSSTTYTMPAADAEVTATYTWNNYTLTVTSGSGDGSTYTYQQVVAIAAETHPDANYSFDKWTGDTSGCADANASSTNYTMAASDATVVATYNQATTVDVNATKDTQILYSWGTADDYNYGSSTSGLAARGTSSTYDNRTLLGGFDISGVGSTITSANLWMRNRWTEATSADVTVARLTRSWTEGTGTGGTAGAGATYNKYDGTNDWTSAGGDWADDSTTVLDTITTTQHQWFSIDVTDIVQHWKDNAGSNYGIIIISDESTDSDYFDINAKEESSGQYTSYLRIVY